MSEPDQVQAVLITHVTYCPDGDLVVDTLPDVGDWPWLYFQKGTKCPTVGSVVEVRKTQRKVVNVYMEPPSLFYYELVK